MKAIQVFLFIMLSTLMFCIIGCSSPYAKSNCVLSDSLHWVNTSRGCLHLNVYQSKIITDSPNLVIVLHGDAPFNKPGYQYKMARLIAEQNQNTIAIGLLRPGYTDDDENSSDGQRGLSTGDNYTPYVIATVAQAIEKLKKSYHPKQVILIGHSGGAAISGAILGTEPLLVNKAVLVSCPCDVPKWRKYMGKRQFYNLAWADSVSSISPLAIVEKINKKTEIVIVCGQQDETTPLQLSINYFQKTQAHGLASKLIQLPQKGHEIFFDAQLFKAINQLLNE